MHRTSTSGPDPGRSFFGSFNKLDKTTPEVLSTWARILVGQPGSRLVLRSRGLDDPRVADRFGGLLAEAGVDRIGSHCMAGSLMPSCWPVTVRSTLAWTRSLSLVA
ncbi:MAG: hypothetical protein CM1200mP2_56940 [Planctomycetaceae bacterium]|nr:MAG: hypothetical protein CM1200mP2_56940 [Planctomycetaceae bacterium]